MHSISYRNFKRGDFKLKDVEEVLNKKMKEKEKILPVREEGGG